MIIHTDTSDYIYEDRHVLLVLENIGPEKHTKKDVLLKNLTCNRTVHVGQATSFIRLPDPSLEPVEVIISILLSKTIN